MQRLHDCVVHPRSVHRVLAEESRLVTPCGPWPERLEPPDTQLGGVRSSVAAEGNDRHHAIGAASFLGEVAPELLPLDGIGDDDDVGNGMGVEGVHRLYGVERMSTEREIGLLCVPDLLWDVVQTSVVPEAPK